MSERYGRRLFYSIFGEGTGEWKELDDDERRRWCEHAAHFMEAVVPPDTVIVKRDRLNRLIAASDKLRRFSRSVVDYGGHVPESEALTDADLQPIIGGDQ